MIARSAIQVGIVVALALTVLIGGLWYLTHFNPNTYTIRVAFSDTAGLVHQAPVRMRGVLIGEVQNVELEGLQPIVTLRIQDKIKIPTDSTFTIASGILILNPHVEVVPGVAAARLQPGQQVAGALPQDALKTMSTELAQTVANLNTTMGDMSKRFEQASVKIDKILDESSIMVKNLNQTVASAKGLITDPRLRGSLMTTVENFRTVSENAKETSVSLKSSLTAIAKNGQGTFKGLTDKLGNVLTRIDSTIDEANNVVKKLTDQVTDPRLQQSLQETVELARTTLARFDQIASDIHSLTGDAKLQSDLKQSVGNLKSASEHGAQAVNKLNDILGVVSNSGANVKKFHFPTVSLMANVSEEVNPGHLRVDLDSRFALGKDVLDLGLYDVGQDTRLNLQGGYKPSEPFLIRYGLYASKIGAGLEWMPRPGTGIRGDLYDTAHPRLDIRGLIRVNNDASLWLGADSIFANPVPVVGIQYVR
jgi:phospholipid/cholesterol/gamma-HCH transport system substrate-binding protein